MSPRALNYSSHGCQVQFLEVQNLLYFGKTLLGKHPSKPEIYLIIKGRVVRRSHVD